MKNNITLIGMPGAGKSTTGIILAKNLSMGFLDSDIDKIPYSLSTRKTMLAGILTAVKEDNLEKEY